MEANTQITVRLYSYKSFRNYGGRTIKSTPHLCKATFIQEQRDNTFLVLLSEDCAGFKKGHKISVSKIDFNI